MSYSSLTKAKISAYDKTSYSRDYTSFFELTEYHRTYELCNESTVGHTSGNVIKFFSYNLKPPFTIGNRDGYMSKKLEKMRAEMNVVSEQDVVDADAPSTDAIENDLLEEDEGAALLGEAPKDNDSETVIDGDYVESEFSI